VGPLYLFNLIHFSKAPTSKFTNMIFLMSTNGEIFEVINEIKKNNFPFWLHFQILLDFELEKLETIQILILLEF
jgi:hypothetical protein